MKHERTVDLRNLKMAVWEKGVRITAEEAGLSVATIDKLINGRNKFMPRPETQLAIAKALGKSRDFFFPIATKKIRVC